MITTLRQTKPRVKTSFLVQLRDELRQRREARAARRTLERQLASYTTRRDVDDLLALVGDSEDPSAEQIRTIVTRNLHAHAS